ncbi:YVC1-vacuolar cation channel [Fusarium albosuccineum]|uniref:YVC1-vacuolar cation channel n=1 Tax=Fusarium albosuccineum TaxID=1237068 RepID=A0A8H4LK30_9HYPO|nr:YVC1-vacuolar cation channel [Fusarium albosuccineum]
MFSSLLRRPRAGPRRVDRRRNLSASPSPGPARRPYTLERHATADFTEADDDDADDSHDEGIARFRSNDRHVDDDGEEEEEDEDGDDGRDEDGRRAALPILPLFSATHLDSLPVYSITHAIRIIVSTRTETTLSWDQLRSPQVSQFLVKPMQQQIRAQHYTRATLYALMANCLQFNKEGERYPGNAGISSTRAKVCELLALKLLKEYNTRELIDALAYDFYPLQGLPGIQVPNSPTSPRKTPPSGKLPLIASRTSTLEVAIRASAKHFLAHPLVVQQLEAIWSGAITFHSSADSLHREPPQGAGRNGNGHIGKPDDRTPLLGSAPSRDSHYVPPGRRTASLYDPRQASLMKLSRLRVPRYRSFLSTISLAVLIGLFFAVLAERSVQITALELIFWFWSAGFMLDELVGFNEQGFALYIMSFWNIFDLGILLLLIVYYCMRAYGVFLVDPHHWNDMAYDVLAANAILLLPRIFSILDHYQYFSQLLIAFRLMAVDLVAVFVLIGILCSGFFFFFTLSKNSFGASDVAYKIFQILMGFTPAAWEVWDAYNWLGRTLLVLFLSICHFLVVTILITVLTNSFMAIASNANEEHQFLFAINTISMVKNDALFSYIAPSNIFAWILMPLRYFMPLKLFVWLNRTVIKATHFPVLFCIYLYEKYWLAPSMYEPTDLVEHPTRDRSRAISFMDPVGRAAMFSPSVRLREESVAGFQKDRALEEVFRRVPDPATLRTQRRNERRKTQTAIRNWMDQHDEAGASPGNWPTLDSAMPPWQRRMSVGFDRTTNLRHVSDVRSTASDPADLASNAGHPLRPSHFSRTRLDAEMAEYKDQTDADGDDELVTNDEDEDDHGTNAGRSHVTGSHRIDEEAEDGYFTPMASNFGKLASSVSSSGKGVPPTPRQRKGAHNRTMSSNTILFNPQDIKQVQQVQSASSVSPPHGQSRPRTSGRTTAGEKTPRRSSPRRSLYVSNTKPRPVMPPRGMTEAGAVSRSALLSIEPRNRPKEVRRLSSVDLSAMSDHLAGGDPIGAMPGSFQTQMAMAMMKDNRLRAAGGDTGDRDRMGRLVLARMKTLEESFADVIKEMRDLKNSSTAPTTRRNSSGDEARLAPLIEVAGRDRLRKNKLASGHQKVASKRPVSRRSLKEPKPGVWDHKGKGKEVAYESDDEAETDDSLFQKGGSL